MDINCEYYKVFYYVAKYGNVSQAARYMTGSQPNLTRMIKNLEGQLGCPLFLRTSHGMRLTPEGERLYKHIRVAFEHIEAGEAEICESRSLESGSVFVAASEVALRCLLLPVLKKYRTRYPGVRLGISNHSTPQAIEALKNGTADIAVVTAPTVLSPMLTETEIKEVRETAICSPAFSELLGRRVSLSELVKYPLISLGKETKSFEFYAGFFKSCGQEYKPDIEAFTADQILPMVEADLGIGFVPREFVHPSDNVEMIELKEEIPRRSICLIKRKEQPLSAAAKELERMIMSC